MSPNRITILHDSFGASDGLRKNWGFAALIEFGGMRVLFDTGNNAEVFAHNTAALRVDLSDLDFVVISHRHGDHTSGLNHLLERNPDVAIYVPKEIYGVFGSSLPGTFYPRCLTLPMEMRYYDGLPPELIRHGTPWEKAHFVHVERTTEAAPGFFLIHTVSDVPGTRDLCELSLSIIAPGGQILVVGCSHPGIEKILAAAAEFGGHVQCLFGGLHLVTTAQLELERIAGTLRDTWKVDRIAPGHCTGEPGFDVLQRTFGERYVYAGLGTSIAL
jgi:7,8-dihydropterin-6-yl-methyl-4-(beta-D-ribofuranosyl)aminobenzene 5'-phosphate synthase